MKIYNLRLIKTYLLLTALVSSSIAFSDVTINAGAKPPCGVFRYECTTNVTEGTALCPDARCSTPILKFHQKN